MGSDIVSLCLVAAINIKEFANQTPYRMGFFLFRRRATIQTVSPATLHGQANARATGCAYIERFDRTAQ
jgi:hypothetical protein